MPDWLDEAVAADVSRVARIALAEDGERDLSSLVSVPAGLEATARIEVRESLVLAGLPWASAVAAEGGCAVTWEGQDGGYLPAGRIAGRLSGALDRILRVERPLLNLLQRASGIATVTRSYVDAVAGTGTRILHTRKTAPGLRLLDVSAALAGGASLHRMGLDRTVMLKDNHWAALREGGGSLEQAVAEARRLGAESVQIEVEEIEQVEEACRAGVDRLLVDNQTPAVLAEWSALARRLHPGVEIEATGGITLENVRAYAEAGPDYISIGALTHSVRAADLGLELQYSVKGER